MFDWLNFHTLALVTVAAQFGGMGFFAFLFTPMVFKVIDREDAANFFRQIFPIYYRIMACAAIVPSLLLMPEQTYDVEVATLLTVAGVFVFTARVMVPMANKAREHNNSKKFSNVHRISVVLHSLQFIAITITLVRLA